MTGITEKHIEQAGDSPTLGPAYFAAQDVAERYMAAFEAEHFKPLAEKFANEFQDKLWGDISDWLLSDTERNLQGAMWRHTDDMVKHVLAGEKWAMEKFVLGERYDCAKIRETVAKHIPEELQNARIADLEADVKDLKDQLRFYQSRML